MKTSPRSEEVFFLKVSCEWLRDLSAEPMHESTDWAVCSSSTLDALGRHGKSARISPRIPADSEIGEVNTHLALRPACPPAVSGTCHPLRLRNGLSRW